MRLLLMLVSVLVLTSTACARIAHIHPGGVSARPYTPVVRAGGFLYLAGQVGGDAANGGALVPGGIEAETRQVLENIKTLLAASGSSMDRVVKCTVFLVDIGEWDRMNTVYRTYFAAGRYPARTAVGVSGLPGGARVEIECLARA
ncbi:MAG: hypothetical protein RL625_843 [Gemmatimonadota bacterium]|jgi:reactive intermediate/imine deaminase